MISALKTNHNIDLTSDTNTQINQIIKEINSSNASNFSNKIIFLNNIFLNRPYQFSALGEGANGEFDQSPLYRTDAFDCETYVDTILALALSKDLNSFKNNIQKIRYKDGEISFLKRNHFTCIDWNKNNQQQAFVKDITNTILNKQNKSIALIAKADIDKANWYKNISANRIYLPNSSTKERSLKLKILRNSGNKLQKSLSEISYIPFKAFFNKNNKPNMQLIKQIPNGSIMEIVRPNWELRKKIGTDLIISHLGFVIWENNQPFFVHASSEMQKVVKVSLIDYLLNSKKNNKNNGVNIQIICEKITNA
ncbi:MAG: hypothetical protein A3E88_07740 [Legionellales bacterium RIFCSPHIGHO2_12_FULL_35_11]|nr:MAG: hypothetical protein A3E88_07740 [Legionellales bacterium RIFCSPHIGHO2_12_FULL_35_11]